MSEAVISNGKCYLAQFDLSSELNAIAADMSAEAPESTAMVALAASPAKARLGGLVDTKVAVNGFFNSEQIIFNSMGLANVPLIIAPTGADNTSCFLFRPVLAKYSLGGKLGEVYPYKVEAEGNGPFVSGTILLPKLARIISGTGTGRQLGAVAAGKKIYAVLHVFSATPGPDTLDVVLESDVSAAFLTINRIAATLGVGFSINDAGDGYAVNDVITVVQSGGSGGTLTVTSISGGGGTGPVTGLTLTTPGTGYAIANGLATTVAPVGGTGFKLNILALTDTPVITFTQKTAVGSEWKEAAGPFTDDYWRVKYTVGGVDPSFTFAVGVGIL